jgi:putative ABC transport system substrate-binding protein
LVAEDVFPGTLSALVTPAWAQRAKRIGVFLQGFEEQGRDIAAMLVSAMRPYGWREGVNLEIVLVALGTSRAPDAAVALLRSGVDAVFTANGIPAGMLKQATSTIPIVAILGDPVKAGFAQSLTRPGGNITGLAFSLLDIQLKSLDLARAFIPRLSRFRFVSSPTDHAVDFQNVLDPEARAGGIVVDQVKVASLEELAQRFKGLSISERGAAFLTLPLLPFDARQAAELAIARKVATFSPYKQEVRDGLLGSYSKDFDDEIARVAAILDKVLRGAKPAEIPFEQPTQTHIAINKRTAAALGLAVPPELLVRADEVIS